MRLITRGKNFIQSHYSFGCFRMSRVNVIMKKKRNIGGSRVFRRREREREKDIQLNVFIKLSSAIENRRPQSGEKTCRECCRTEGG